MIHYPTGKIIHAVTMVLLVLLPLVVIVIGPSALLVQSFQPTVLITTTNSKASRTSSSSPSTSLSQLYMSIPTVLDTVTSGLASICRSSRGVTVLQQEQQRSIDTSFTASFQIEVLYDVENSIDCRRVREVITEYDLNVNVIVPASKNSRCFVDPSNEYYIPRDTTNSTIIIPRMIVRLFDDDNVDDGGKEEDNLYTIEGADDIVAFLDSKCSTTTATEEADDEDEDDDEDENDTLSVVVQNVGNVMASLLRIGRGTKVCTAAAYSSSTTSTTTIPRPKSPLILYSYEGNQFCRLVREVLTELDVPYTLKSVGKLSNRRTELSEIQPDGSTQCPYLIDPNTNIQMKESSDIIRYLYSTYALYTPPNELLQWVSDYVLIPFVKPVYSIIAPLQAGKPINTNNDDDNENDNNRNNETYQQEIETTWDTIQEIVTTTPVVIYTYQLSPFAWEAKAVLDNLNIEYKEISLGLEWIPGLIIEGGAIIRATLLEKTGQSSLPHVFINGQSIGGLYSGTPGLLKFIEQGQLTSIQNNNAKLLIGSSSSSAE